MLVRYFKVPATDTDFSVFLLESPFSFAPKSFERYRIWRWINRHQNVLQKQKLKAPPKRGF